jgi:ribulose-bisphosphate carboxylase small chain
MRITQGTFSFLPDFTDEQIAAQIHYALDHGWAMSVEYTDDPHPRNSYWEMWGMPQFDLLPDESGLVLREVRACREAHPSHYVKLIAYDSSRGRGTTALSFLVNRTTEEPGFRLERTDSHDRAMRYQLHSYATDKPEGLRYQDDGAAPPTTNLEPAAAD